MIIKYIHPESIYIFSKEKNITAKNMLSVFFKKSDKQ